MTDFVLHPRLETDSLFIRDLKLSQLRLNNVKSVPWLVLVPRRAEITEIYQLAKEDRGQLMEEVAQAAKVLTDLYAPDKINIAALGNIVPQLHVHVMARFASDAAWPHPIFGRMQPEPYEDAAVEVIKTKITDEKFWR
jgi:diadenosine tetraphosphate (Ap4A) HIT family hydrolase